MSTIRGLEPVADIVDRTCMGIGDTFGHIFGDLYRDAITVLKEFNYDSTNTPKHVCLPIDPLLKRSILPADFVNYLGVGHIHNNDVVMLGYNPYMMRPCVDGCGNESLGEGGLPNGDLYQFGLDGAGRGMFINPDGSNTNDYPDWWWRQDYGQGGGWNSKGYYKVDKTAGWIDFNPAIRLTKIVLIYISNGFTPSVSNYLPEMMSLAMEERLKEMYYKYSAGVSMGREYRDWDKKAKDQAFISRLAHRNAERRQRSQPMYELTAAYRRSYGPHIKM